MLKLFQERQLFINEDIEVAKSTSEQATTLMWVRRVPTPKGLNTPANTRAQNLLSQPLAPRRAAILPPDHFNFSISLTSIHRGGSFGVATLDVRLAPFGDGTTRSANKPLQHVNNPNTARNWPAQAQVFFTCRLSPGVL
jgi:hypothetical protein